MNPVQKRTTGGLGLLIVKSEVRSNRKPQKNDIKIHADPTLAKYCVLNYNSVYLKGCDEYRHVTQSRLPPDGFLLSVS